MDKRKVGAYMSKPSLQELDEYIAKYGFNDKTDIDDMRTAMFVNAKRKDRENEGD